MEEWIPFLVWIVIFAAVSIVLKLMLTNTFSSITMALFLGGAFLVILSPYKVDGCQYSFDWYDTARTIILLCSFFIWVSWTVYQVLRDNKHHRFCIRCRVKPDMLPPKEYDIVQYDDEETKEPLLV